MERRTNRPDRKARHTVVFSEEEVMRILYTAAVEEGKALPEYPTFIWFPPDIADDCPLKVTIGVDVDEEARDA